MKFSKICISSLLAATLSACGGGGGGSAPVSNNSGGGGGSTPPEVPDTPTEPPAPSYETGVFLDSPVEGLHYQTPSYQGLTNEQGQFRFALGESVTFSIGGTLLGEIEGASLVTPFSLFEVQAPEQEHVIAAALSNDGTVLTLDKALNIATLLQNLDLDGNPDNGIDLGDAHSVLESTVIDFTSHKATQFGSESNLAEIRSTLGLSGEQISVQDAAAHLYSSLNIQVVAANLGNSSGNDGVQNNFATNTRYDDEGRPVLEEIDKNGDGLVDISIDYLYDGDLLIQKSNSRLGSTEYFAYDPQDQLIEHLTEYENGNGSKETYSYSDNKVHTFTLDRDNDGTPDRIITYTYDGSGNTIETKIDANGDGTVDQITYAAFYPDGRQATYSEDKNKDGTPNLVIAYTYDAEGNRKRFNITIDDNQFPSETSLFTYSGSLIYEYFALDQDYRLKSKETYAYDSHDRRTGVLKDSNGDGTANIRIQYKYDMQGNRILIAEDSNRDGIADKVWRRTLEGAELTKPWEKIFSAL